MNRSVHNIYDTLLYAMNESQMYKKGSCTKDKVIISSGVKSAIFWKQFEHNFFGSIWILETQNFWSREKIFKTGQETRV